jgi:hypothetical protein
VNRDTIVWSLVSFCSTIHWKDTEYSNKEIGP